jgi:hypothetical protein
MQLKEMCKNAIHYFLRNKKWSNLKSETQPILPRFSLHHIANCEFWFNRKILFICEMKQDEILLQSKVKGLGNFCKITFNFCKFWVKFDPLLYICHGIIES